MTTQRNILPQVVERIRQDAPDCAIALTGRPPDRKTVLTFPRWEDFAKHVDALVQTEADGRDADSQNASDVASS